MSEPHPTPSFLDGLQCWGLWPAVVMVLARMETAALIGDPRVDVATVLAFAGTLGLYGLDRFLERRHQSELADRHHAPPILHKLFPAVIVMLCLGVLPSISGKDVLWVLWLTASGGLYCTVTLGWLKGPAIGKECLGALCFASVVLLNHDATTGALWLPFLAMGFANFVWAGQADRERDLANGLIDVPDSNRAGTSLTPEHMIALARVLSLLAAVWFGTIAGPWQCFTWVALAHAVRPTQAKWNIDWCFLPLLGTLIR